MSGTGWLFEVSAECEHPAIERFVNLAVLGRSPGAGRVERGARAVALAMVNHGLVLDEAAVEEFVEFVRYAKREPTSARELIGGPLNA